MSSQYMLASCRHNIRMSCIASRTNVEGQIYQYSRTWAVVGSRKRSTELLLQRRNRKGSIRSIQDVDNTATQWRTDHQERPFKEECASRDGAPVLKTEWSFVTKVLLSLFLHLLLHTFEYITSQLIQHRNPRSFIRTSTQAHLHLSFSSHCSRCRITPLFRVQVLLSPRFAASNTAIPGPR